MRGCFICQDSTPEPYCEVGRHAYLKCPDCGLIYVDAVEDWSTLYHAYDGGFWKSLRRKVTGPFRRFRHYRNFRGSMERARSIIEFISRQEIDGPAGVKFLDIGCNKGFLLAASIERQWDVYGIEVVPELLVPFKREYPEFADHVLSLKLADAQDVLGNEEFHIIAGIDVIEHFESAYEDMMIIHSLLKPGGIFVVQTPDAGCQRAARDGAGWSALKPLEHLHLFNRDNLILLALRIGFEEPSFHPPFEEADGNLAAVFRKKR